jgi:ABC-type thiamin/hydroxymethylpyrimidine transport system permease subunit
MGLTTLVATAAGICLAIASFELDRGQVGSLFTVLSLVLVFAVLVLGRWERRRRSS